jgi:protein arginine N-methyltransferase 1
MTYDLSDYGRMLADNVRMDAYAYALKAAVTPESVVLDIGAATGIHALLACKFGARKVYAVEPQDDIHLAREIAAANGYSERIDFIQNLSTNISLPEAADLIISDLRGALPLFGQHIPSIIDARQRHLAPGGRLIPQRDTLWAALIEARDVYRDMIGPWNRPYGLNMEPAKAIALNRWETANTDMIRSSHLLTEPHRLAVLDYTTIQSPDVGAQVSLPATRNGTAHGWLLWFDAQLTEEIGFSNGPEQRKFAEVYGRAFFPLLEPVPVEKGDIVKLAVTASLTGGEYIWDWASQVHPRDDPEAVNAQFEQSTSFDGVFDARQLAKQVAGQQPALGREGEIDRFILSNMDGRATIDEIAHRLQNAHPDQFGTHPEAIVYIHQLTQQYQ